MFTFDGENKLIICDYGLTYFSCQELYSYWKDWVILDDNLKYLQAISTIGGDPTVNGKYLGITYFLENNWKIRPYSGNHTLTVDGNLYSRDGLSPFILAIGNYNVLINLTTSNIIDEVSTTGSTGLSSSDISLIVDSIKNNLQSNFDNIASDVKNILSDDLIKLLEIYKILGLDPTQPLIVTQNSRVVENITQNFQQDPYTKTVTLRRI